MSETEPTITNPEKPEKVKDPKRVEAGKRLGAISKAVKAAKTERLEAEGKKDEEGNWKTTAGVVGVCVLALAAYRFSSFWDPKSEGPNVTESVTTQETPHEAPQPKPQQNNNIDRFL